MAPKKKPAHGRKAKGVMQGAHRPPKEVSGAAGSRGPSEPSSRSEAPQYEAVGGEWVVCQKQARSQRAEADQKASRASTVQKARQPAAAAASKAGQTASACVRQPGYGKGRSPATATGARTAQRPRLEDSQLTSAAGVATGSLSVQLAEAAAADALEALETGVQTRQSALERSQLLRAQRAEIETALANLRELWQEKERDMLRLLSNPQAAWGTDAVWQLSMAEFALETMDENAVALKPRRLGMCFRALAEQARHPDEIPRLRGLYELHALHAVLQRSPSLQRELRVQLERFKRQYCSLLRGAGRFRTLVVLPGETILELMRRTHVAMLSWRPPGRPGAAASTLAPPTSQAGGVYLPEWREETNVLYHSAAGKTLSLRGAQGVATACSKRYLKSLPEAERPQHESHETVRLHDMQFWFVQRQSAVENSFSKRRNVLQWDEVTINKVAWVVVTLSCERLPALREREVIATFKLRPDADGHKKTGVNVGASNVRAVNELGLPIDRIDFCVSDGTASNASLTIASERHKGGAFAHIWTSMRAAKHVLCFFILCLSHVINNEVKNVCEAAGACRREHLLAHSGSTKSGRHRIPELLADVVLAVKESKGCKNYVRVSEGLARLGDMPGGVDTRWLYWVYTCMWLAPTTRRLELIVCCLLHEWLCAQGDEGLFADAEQTDEFGEKLALTGATLLEKVSSIKDAARRELLLELLDPEIRVWLSFLAIYGERSADRFLKFTENDGPGVAFKAPRVLRLRLAYLDALASDNDETRDLEGGRPWKGDFAPLRAMVAKNTAAFSRLDVRAIVRKAARAASTYFRQHTAAWRTNPALVALGTMDEEGEHAVLSAQELLALAKQGRGGLIQSMLPHLPDSADATELSAAITNATEGVGLWFQDDALGVFKRLASCKRPTQLRDVAGGSDVYDSIWSVGVFVPISNFFSETVVKTLSRDLHGTQRRSEMCATRLTAPRHRGHVYPTTAADWSAASAALGHNVSKRVTEKEGLAAQLQDLRLDSMELSAFVDEPQEEEEEGEAEEEGEEGSGEAGGSTDAADGGTASLAEGEGRQPGWPLEKGVSTAAIRRSLQVGNVVEVLWAVRQDGDPEVYLARVEAVMRIKIKIRWLHEDTEEENVYVECPFFTKVETWSMKQLWNPVSDVSQIGSAEAPRWRRSAIAEDAEAARAAANRAEGGGVSWDTIISDMEARGKGEETGGEDEVEDEALFAGRPGSDDEEVEPELQGPPHLRVGEAGYISSYHRQWFSDSNLANAHYVDERPDGESGAGSPLRYNYPRDVASACSIFRQRGGQRVLQLCDCVMVQQVCDGAHWHNVALIGPQRLAVHWEPFGTSIFSRTHPLARVRDAFDAAPKATGWQLVSVTLNLQSDGYQCGPWAHWFRRRLFAYCADDELMSKQSFAEYLSTSPGISPLGALRNRREREAAGAANTAFMHEERVRLRWLLRAAAREDALPYEHPLQDAFRRAGAAAAARADAVVLDEGLEGDEKYFDLYDDS